MPKVHAFEACELVEKAVTAEAEDIKVTDGSSFLLLASLPTLA